MFTSAALTMEKADRFGFSAKRAVEVKEKPCLACVCNIPGCSEAKHFSFFPMTVINFRAGLFGHRQNTMPDEENALLKCCATKATKGKGNGKFPVTNTSAKNDSGCEHSPVLLTLFEFPCILPAVRPVQLTPARSTRTHFMSVNIIPGT